MHTQTDLDAIADSLNTRPRATHNWRTPQQVFAQTSAKELLVNDRLSMTKPMKRGGG